ncbi:MAG: retron St85 family effector protein, partial [SAR324 cluster bacterium]|nr:retron St85 family effector protein [SAR324 cluster bacterium]
MMPSKYLPRKISDSLKGLVSEQITLKKTSNIVFICGKKPEYGQKGCRDWLLTYAKKNLPNINFFIPDAHFSANNKNDLLSIENELAEYSDCVVIILESAGTFAELGAFSNNEKLVKKILVVNDSKFKDEKSFINEGPIQKL